MLVYCQEVHSSCVSRLATQMFQGGKVHWSVPGCRDSVVANPVDIDSPSYLVSLVSPELPRPYSHMFSLFTLQCKVLASHLSRQRWRWPPKISTLASFRCFELHLQVGPSSSSANMKVCQIWVQGAVVTKKEEPFVFERICSSPCCCLF